MKSIEFRMSRKRIDDIVLGTALTPESYLGKPILDESGVKVGAVINAWVDPEQEDMIVVKARVMEGAVKGIDIASVSCGEGEA